MKVYVDSDYRCYTTNKSGLFREFDVSFFDDKCNAFIEGYRYIPEGQTWTRPDGKVFCGEMVTPWKPYTELDTAQREYEKQIIQDQAATIAELDAALLDATYNSLITEVE